MKVEFLTCRVELTHSPNVYLQICGCSNAGKMIATARIVDWDSDCAYLSAVHVDPDHRRKGIGRALVQFAISECRKAGKPTLGLDVHFENTAAIGLYRSLGFVTYMKHDNTRYMGCVIPPAAGGGA